MSTFLILVLSAGLVAGPQQAAGGARFRGRVLDPRGSPLAGVGLALKDEPGSILGRTGPDGAFELKAFQVPPLRHLVIAEGQSICTAVATVSGLCGPKGDYLLVGAPARVQSGRVVDPEGNPIEDAELTAIVDSRRLLLGFPRPLDSDTLVAPRTQSDALGQFAIEVPAVEGLTLCARSQGCAPVRRLVAPTSNGELQPVELTLRRTTPPWRGLAALHGRVLRLDGSPAAGARVLLGRAEAWAREDGSFTVEMLRGFGPGDALCAVLPGHMPFLSFDPANEFAAYGTEVARVVLRLGGPSLSVAGHVFDELGNPCAGWLVEIADGTAISPASQPSLRVEHIAGGRPAGLPVTTDSKGAFRINGLMERTYVLQAEPKWESGFGAVMVRSGPIWAGSADVELRLEREPWITPFRGRLVDLDGTPLPNVRIALYLEQSLSWPESLERTATDAWGHFEMPRVPKTGSCFAADGARLPLSSSVETAREWTLPTARTHNLRFDWERDTAPPTELMAFDSAGVQLWIYTFVAGKPVDCCTEVELNGVRSHLLAVQRSLSELRMRFSDGAVETLPVRLEPSGLTQIAID